MMLGRVSAHVHTLECIVKNSIAKTRNHMHVHYDNSFVTWYIASFSDPIAFVE